MRSSIGPRRLTRIVEFCGAVAFIVATAAEPAFAGAAAASGTALQSQDPAKTHVHAWVKQTRKEWVPPEKKVVQVGVDDKGKPVYETQIVKPGYWKTVTYYSCSCGATRE